MRSINPQSAKPVDPRTFTLHPGSFDEVSQKRTVYRIEPAHGTLFESMLKPGYWVHVAKRLRPSDVVESLSEDGTWLAHFHVIAQGFNWTKVIPLPGYPLQIEPVGLPAEIDPKQYAIEWAGKSAKFRVMRVGLDGPEGVLQENLYPKSAAVDWLLANIGKQGKSAVA